MTDNGTAEYAYQQSVTDRGNQKAWLAEGRKREAAGKKETPLPLYSGLLGAFFG